MKNKNTKTKEKVNPAPQSKTDVEIPIKLLIEDSIQNALPVIDSTKNGLDKVDQ